MRHRSSPQRTSIGLVIVLLLPFASCGHAWGESASQAAQSLHLEVRLRGKPIGLIGNFLRREDGELFAQRRELEELGIRVPGRYAPADRLPLTTIPGLRYRYDEPSQSIDIDLPESERLPKRYDLAPPEQSATGGYSATGAVLNYTLYGSSAGRRLDDFWLRPGLSASLDARVFSPFGVVTQTGIVSSRPNTGRQSDVLRLDTAWSYSDPVRMLSYRAGDTISGGLTWTRPIRMGGVQVQRNFGLRPDLITLPLPSLSGSAAVPSTVDVFVNGTRAASQDVSSGPFRLDNLPILTGNGNASVVVRDASGRQTETTLPFIVSHQLLRPGLVDFSVEAGMPRLDYGLRSSVYAEDIAGSGSIRYGLSDRITLMAHAEAMRSFAGGSAGAVIGLGSLGLLTAAASASTHSGAAGGQGYAAFETRMGGVTLLASTQRSFASFADLASVASGSAWSLASPQGISDYVASASMAGSAAFRSTLPPRVLDRLSIGIPVPSLGGGLSFGLTHIRPVAGTGSRIVNASYTRSFGAGASFYATAFANLGSGNTRGVFAGVSVPLGDKITSSIGASRYGSDWALATEVARQLDPEPGSFGWRLRDTEGTPSSRRRSASLAYRGSSGQIEGSVTQTGGAVTASGQLDGALVAAGGGLFLANRIDDAFAVAKVGAPGVDVLFENRVVARSDARGNALVSGLRSYQANKISIDSRDLPVNANPSSTQEVLAPPDRAGVVVDFGVRSVVTSAVVILRGGDGAPLQPGLRGRLLHDLRGVSNDAEDFTIGYEGRAFIHHLGPENTVVVTLPTGECRARFPFAPRNDRQVEIGPVPCM